MKEAVDKTKKRRRGPELGTKEEGRSSESSDGAVVPRLVVAVVVRGVELDGDVEDKNVLFTSIRTNTV